MTKKIKLRIKQNEQKIEELKKEIKYKKMIKILVAIFIIPLAITIIFERLNHIFNFSIFDFLTEIIIFLSKN